jgi:hypothetical protein
MTAHDYLELAERYQKALATVKNAFARQHLQAMVRSYRTLADSEGQLRKSGIIVETLGKSTKNEGQ